MYIYYISLCVYMPFSLYIIIIIIIIIIYIYNVTNDTRPCLLGDISVFYMSLNVMQCHIYTFTHDTTLCILSIF